MTTRELIIDGQHVDLPAQVDVTFEYVNDFTSDPGKISLSHSYTIKLPKTARNARILDDPGTPGHASSRVRRYLNAHYYSNGIDLIGDAQAYVLKTTADSYEVALVWNTLKSLEDLGKSSATLNDLPGLPELPWITSDAVLHPDFTAASEKEGALFARYTTGLGEDNVPQITNGAAHPSMRLSNLLDRILQGAGVPYMVSAEAQERMQDIVLLAAPSHAPTREMEIRSGSYPQNVFFSNLGGVTNNLSLGRFVYGWDAPAFTQEGFVGAGFYTTFDDMRVLVNMAVNASADLSRAVFYIKAKRENAKAETVLSRPFVLRPEGWVAYFDEEIGVDEGVVYEIGCTGVPSGTPEPTAYKAGFPLVAVNRPHKTISISNHDNFPLAGNLPDIKQWDFVKACAALFGLVPVIQSGQLNLRTYDELLQTSRALDWTNKVDMSSKATVAYTLDGWAQRNTTAFKEDIYLNFDPNAEVLTEDATIAEQRDRFSLPFAASIGDQAIHYRLEEPLDPGNVKVEDAEDVKIQPRIFQLTEENGERVLQFGAGLYGAGLAEANYSALQKVVRTPIVLTLNARLSEVNLAHLDLTRPVYLAQYGHYYSILKIQTSDTDLCKLELLQIA